MRADSGFWAWKLIARLNAHKISWSITVRLHEHMKQVIAAIVHDAWTDIDHTIGGQAQVAKTIYTTGKGKYARSVRLIVRRTRLTDEAQRRLWPDWRHHAFITNRADLNTIEADQYSSTVNTSRLSSPSVASNKAPDSNTSPPVITTPTQSEHSQPRQADPLHRA